MAPPEKLTPVEAAGKRFCLTAREKRVIRLVVAGYTNNEIAQALAASKGAIDEIVAKISQKLGVTNRLELLLVALQHRVIAYVEPTFPRDGNHPGREEKKTG